MRFLLPHPAALPDCRCYPVCCLGFPCGLQLFVSAALKPGRVCWTRNGRVRALLETWLVQVRFKSMGSLYLCHPNSSSTQERRHEAQ